MIETYRRLLALLTRRERRQFFLLLVLIFVMGVVEAAGVLSILPFLALVADPGLIGTDPRVNAVYTALGFADPDRFLIAAGLGIFAFVILGLAIKTLTLFAVTRFGYMCGYSLASRLIGGYLSRPYTWFLQRHSADLGKKILSETDNVVSRALIPAIRLIAYGCVVVLMFAFVTLVDPVIALTAGGVFGGSYGLIFLLVRRRLSQLGAEAVAANSGRFQVATEALNAIKEVKLGGLESAYLERFQTPARRLATVSAANVIIGDSPRYVLEGVAFGTMLALVLVLLLTGDRNIADIVPVLGLFAFAGSRLFPTMQQIYRELTAMRFGRALVDTIYDDMIEAQAGGRLKPADRTARLGLSRELKLEGVAYAYPLAPQKVLDGVDITIPARTTVGIVGGSGAGKTTLVDILLGLLPLETGTLRVDGQPVTRETMRAWQNSIGYVPQTIFLTDLSVTANIAFGIPAAEVDHEAVVRAARIAMLHDFVMQELPQGYDTMVGERGVRLSGGQRQRIGIARALYHNPDVLILDEATSALDNLTERMVMEAVHNLGRAKTVVMIAHRLSTVKDCDVIFVIERGRVVAQGRYDDLIATNTQFRLLAAAASA